jgi:hypothetical protein
MIRLLPLFFLLFSATAAVPTPESQFGHKIGVDNELLDWAKVVSYFEALAKSSDRIKFLELGKTVEGRAQIAAVISSPANIKNLEHYREIQMKLSDPRKTSEAEAAKLTLEGKMIVMITCSIHATEVASTHTAVEFAYRLLTEDSNPKFKTILDNVIILLEPSQNPDGVDIVTKWYRKTRGTQWDGTSPPELYHHYVGHDDNRDWYIFTQPETRNTASLENKWHPEIVYDVHQMGANTARIFVPPWMDPVDPNIDPILASLCNSIGAGMATDLAAAGKTGIAMNAMYDFWSPARQYQAYHGGVRILTESASVKLATPIQIKPSDITDQALGYNPRERSWNYLNPWMEGTWRLRDIIDYQSIAFESLLYQAAVRRSDMLRYFYEINKHNVERATPNAFVIPVAQSDPGAARKMLETLAFGETEIERASGAVFGRRKTIRDRQLGDPYAAAVFGVGEDAAGTSGLSGFAPVSWRSSEEALRCDGADAADAVWGRRGDGEGFVSGFAEAGFFVFFHVGSCGFRGPGGYRCLFVEGGREDLEVGEDGLSRHFYRGLFYVGWERAEGN